MFKLGCYLSGFIPCYTCLWKLIGILSLDSVELPSGPSCNDTTIIGN